MKKLCDECKLKYNDLHRLKDKFYCSFCYSNHVTIIRSGHIKSKYMKYSHTLKGRVS